MYLWGMHMHIVHGRDEQLVTEVNDLGILNVEVCQIVCNTHYLTVLHSNVTILKDLKVVFLLRKENMCLINLFHRDIVLIC